MPTDVGTGKGPPPDDSLAEAMERMSRYCIAKPESPSAIHQPQLFIREQLWIALLGEDPEHGILGIGPTVEAALEDFDLRYVASLHPPDAETGDHARR